MLSVLVAGHAGGAGAVLGGRGGHVDRDRATRGGRDLEGVAVGVERDEVADRAVGDQASVAGEAGDRLAELGGDAWVARRWCRLAPPEMTTVGAAAS